MKIKFKKIILHNFLCYKDAELNLESKGYCLVQGENNCKIDNAKSNGSGKSAIFSAICYVLTGETLQGVKTQLKNINSTENSCWASLEFTLNGDEYKLTRYNEPRSLLTIIKNNVDISGKGIKESEAILTENMPELTKDLISGTILLGQGLPDKFSALSPRDRKNYLERLSKTDFMIQMIKIKIEQRNTELNTDLNTVVNQITKLETTLEYLNRDKYNKEQKLDSLNTVNLDLLSSDLAQYKLKLDELTAFNETLTSYEKNNLKELDKISEQLVELTNQKASKSNLILKESYENKNKISFKLQEINYKKTSLQKEILTKKNIKDICPTCGQKLLNVIKPDTSLLEAELTQILNEEKLLKEEQSKLTENHKNLTAEVDKLFSDQFNNLYKNKEDLNKVISDNKIQLYNNQKQIQDASAQITELDLIIKNHNKDLTEIITGIEKLSNEIKTNTDLLSEAKNKQTLLATKLSIIKRIESLVNRDFRGHLLTNVIKYLDTKAKEFCNIVFKTTLLDIKLNDNTLAITYNNKALENLSGGERARVDLILQLSIRAMLIKYLNFNSNIIVLDEVTDFLDSVSCKALMNLIGQELKNVESVFIISHHAKDLGLPIDTELKISKLPDGNSCIM